MILEIAQLQVKTEQSSAFEAAFKKAQIIISSMPGYLGHELQKCTEQVNHYMLLVRWESIEHHEIGFRKSAQYQEWRKLLHHFYDPFPNVLHYELGSMVPASPPLLNERGQSFGCRHKDSLIASRCTRGRISANNFRRHATAQGVSHA